MQPRHTTSTTSRRLGALWCVPLAVALVAGCSSDTRSDISDDAESAVTAVGDAIDEAGNDLAETAARNIATQQGEEQFVNAGQELEGDLNCEAAVVDGQSTIDVSCTGTTKAGGAATLTGQTSEVPGASATELEGHFIGAVDGATVFDTEQLGG